MTSGFRRYDTSAEEGRLQGLRQAKAALERGELVVLPTDTVYGVAANAFSPSAVAGLLKAKGRGRNSPPPVLIAGAHQLEALANQIPEVARKLAEQYWPGALTLVLTAQPALDWDLGETRGTVALRVPNNDVTLELIREFGPIAVSSANLHGAPAATDCDQAVKQLGDSVAVYLDAGQSSIGEASTILDLTPIALGDPVRVLRQGAIPGEELLEFISANTAEASEQ